MIHYNDWKSVRRICYIIMSFLSFFIIIKAVYSGTGYNTDSLVEYVILMLSSTVILTLTFSGNDKVFLFETAVFVYALKIISYDIFKKALIFQSDNPVQFIYYIVIFLFLLLAAIFIFREIKNFNVSHSNRKAIILISIFTGVLVFLQIIFSVYVANIMHISDFSENPFFFFKLIVSDVLFIPVCVYCALKSERNNRYALIFTGVVLFLTASGLFAASVNTFLKVMRYDVNVLKMNFQIFPNDIFVINAIKISLNFVSVLILPVYVRIIEISYIKIFK